jgi:hypothetical protein
MKIEICKKTNSCSVDKETLIRIENYIISNVPNVLRLATDEILKNYSVKITDSFSTEEFKSIKDFKSELFYDDTIEIKLGFVLQENLVFLRLSKYDTSSEIAIEFVDDNVRENAIGILDGIEALLKPYKNMNYIYHNSFINGTLTGICVFLLIYFIISLNYVSDKISYLIYSFATLTLGLFILLANKLKPYSEFDTRSQRIYNEYFKFFKWGILGFVIFGTFVTLIRNKIIGF